MRPQPPFVPRSARGEAEHPQPHLEPELSRPQGAARPPPADRTLGQTVPCLLIPSTTRNAISHRLPGRSGQAEMPCCLGVTAARQVVPGLHFVLLFVFK